MNSMSGVLSIGQALASQGSDPQSQDGADWRTSIRSKLDSLPEKLRAEVEDGLSRRELPPETRAKVVGVGMRHGDPKLLARILAEDPSTLCIHGAINGNDLQVLRKALLVDPITGKEKRVPEAEANTLKLFEVTVDPGATGVLFEIMDCMPKLARVMLNKGGEWSASWKALAQCSGSRHLQTLEVNGQQAVDVSLLSEIMDRSTVHEIVISNGPMLSDGHAAIVDALCKQTSLASMRLRSMDPATLSLYMELPAKRPSLIAMHLDTCRYGTATLNPLVQSGVRLRKLVLVDCKRSYGDDGSIRLGHLLRALDLHTLSLMRSGFRTDELKQLFMALECSESLRFLAVTDRSYGDCLPHLAAAISKNTTLIELGYSCALVGDEALKPLAEAMEINRWLTRLDLPAVAGENQRRLQLLLERNQALARTSIDARIHVGTGVLLKGHGASSDFVGLVANMLSEDLDSERTAIALGAINRTTYNAWAAMQGRAPLLQRPPDSSEKPET